MSKAMEANNNSAIQFELRSEKLAEDLAVADQRITELEAAVLDSDAEGSAYAFHYNEEKARADAAEAKLTAAEDALLGLIPSHRNPADRCWCPLHIAVPHTQACLKAREVLAWIEAQAAMSGHGEPSPANTIPAAGAEISGPLTLCVCSGLHYFSHAFHIEPCEGQWTVGAAKDRAENAIRDGDYVLILNKAGEVVFKAERGHVELPLDQKRFWERAGR